MSIAITKMFDLDYFVNEIKAIRPSFVYIGYDNYNYGLPEPLLSKTKELIKQLEEFTKIRTKSYSKATCESNMCLKTQLRGRGVYGRQFISMHMLFCSREETYRILDYSVNCNK